MNDEMKFLLVGRPDGDSVWLHVGPKKKSALSGWINGTLSFTLYPDNWLSPNLVLTEVSDKKDWLKQRTVLVLTEMLDDAGNAGVLALKERDTDLFLYSMRTQFCYQCVNGATAPRCPKHTLARVYSRDQYSRKLYNVCLVRKRAHSVLI